MNWIPEHWAHGQYCPPRLLTIEEMLMTKDEMLKFLIEKFKLIEQTINNESPDLAWLEIHKAMSMIETWEDGN
jgi:hypothetical protein